MKQKRDKQQRKSMKSKASSLKRSIQLINLQVDGSRRKKKKRDKIQMLGMKQETLPIDPTDIKRVISEDY